LATPARAQSSSSCAVPPPTPQAPTSTPLRKIGTAPWQDNGEAAEAAPEEGQMTLRVIYSADIASAPSSGFNAYLFHAWRPRRDLAWRFVHALRTNRSFPRHIQTHDLLTFWLDHRRTLPWERRIADQAWRAYVLWKRRPAAA
jgi:hypothetical protein